MIISASKRTDILGFYFKEFYNDFINDNLHYKNPYNNQSYKVNIKDITKIVFWTKYPQLSLEDRSNLKHHIISKYECILHHTLNFYDSDIEPFKKIIPIEKIIHSVKEYSSIFGKENTIVRYDPIILTNKYTFDFHKEKFEYLIKEVGNYCNKIIISFVDMYSKIRKNMDSVGAVEINKEIMIILSEYFKTIDFPIETCSESIDILPHASCISGSYVHGYREFCNCAKHIDIGDYNTCKYGCKYCYAIKH